MRSAKCEVRSAGREPTAAEMVAPSSFSSSNHFNRERGRERGGLGQGSTKIILPVRDYDLAATLDSGQVFRWQRQNDSWTGVVGWHWVRLTQTGEGIHAETAGPVADWQWLRDYLQIEVDLDTVLKTFPDDAPMRDAVAACRGLCVLRQDPWECLASFILSSTKQIVQIRQIIALLCERFGEPLTRCSVEPAARLNSATGRTLQFTFPSPAKIACVTEAELRACKMGFRAPHLLARRGRSPTANSIWSDRAVCRWPKRARN